MRDGGILVKICGITSEADALLAVGFGADALGFVFAPSPRQMTPTGVGDIVKRLPHGVLTVGVFRDESPRRVVEIANRIGLGAVQLHGRETPEQSRWIRQRVACTFKAFAAGDPAIGRFGEYGADFLLVDGPSPGSGQVFDWRLAEGVADLSRLVVSGGLDPDNVGQAIAHLRPHGVDVASGVESEPGRKDPHRVGAFVAAARAAARALGHGESGNEDDPDGGGRPDAVGEDGVEVERGPYDWMRP